VLSWSGQGQIDIFNFNASTEMYMGELERMSRHVATLLLLKRPQFSSIPPGKYRHRTSKQTATAFFNILSNYYELKNI
jgi:hypothetical protein